jgi:hypothetical protein
MCSAEMHASIRRCRCRARDARSGATVVELLAAFWRGTWITGQKLYMRCSLSRRIARRHPANANHEIARASRPLAHHSPAPAVPDGVLSDSVRVYALEGIIRDGGILNTVLLRLGLISQPLKIMRTSLAVYLGIIYSYLPFMVLPLFATLEKLDPTLLEAAADLGSPPWRAFLDVTVPQSIPGVIAGSMLVFIPAVGEFVIPSLLGGPDNLMIGRVLES